MDLETKERRKKRPNDAEWQKKPERGANESQSFPARLSVRVDLDYFILFYFLAVPELYLRYYGHLKYYGPMVYFTYAIDGFVRC